MNASEKTTFLKLYKAVKAIITDPNNAGGGVYGLGRTFVDATEIIDRTVAAVKTYTWDKAFPLTERQIALIERAIVEAKAALIVEQKRVEADRTEQIELHAKIEANTIKVDTRSEQQKAQDRMSQEIRWYLMDTTSEREDKIRARIEAKAEAEFHTQWVAIDDTGFEMERGRYMDVEHLNMATAIYEALR